MNRDPHAGRQNITKTYVEVSIENHSYLRWEDPILGMNVEEKVSPVIPGCRVFWTHVNE